MKTRYAFSGLSKRWHRYRWAVCHRAFPRWLWRRFWLDDVPGRAAQLSYYFFLSLFPLLICLSALLGYIFAAETGLDRQLLDYLGAVMPGPAYDIVRTAAEELLQARGGGKLSFGLVLALWLASSGMEAVIEGLNAAFQVEEARPWWRRRLVALGLTVTVAIMTGCAFGLALVGSRGGRSLATLSGMGNISSPVRLTMQWVVIVWFLLGAINLVYFFGPNLRKRRRTQVILPGAVVALICWLAASAGLRFYLHYFSSFGQTYGSLAAMIALLVWLYLTGAALLLGAEINSGIQARLDDGSLCRKEADVVGAKVEP